MSDTESSSSRNSQDTAGATELSVTAFMESLSRSRRSSFMDLETEITDIENEIIQKSGIEIQKNVNALKELAVHDASLGTTPSEETKMDSTTPEPSEKKVDDRRPEDFNITPGAMMLGKEEEINVLPDVNDDNLVDDQD